jgi:ATP-dependent RNA circularization protein (DNA/RNA ligase family)
VQIQQPRRELLSERGVVTFVTFATFPTSTAAAATVDVVEHQREIPREGVVYTSERRGGVQRRQTELKGVEVGD